MSLAGPAPLQGGSSSSISQQQAPSIPRLAEPFDPAASSGGDGAPDEAGEPGKKHKKRSLFGFGKRKDKDSDARSKSPSKPETTHTSSAAAPAAAASASASASQRATSRRAPTPPALAEQSAGRMPSSPGRALSSSPRLSSPAGSQIFERDVQESAAPLMPNSPAIPNHISTENHIPPVLDASSEVVTDDHLNPDTVEIITHTHHQPAGLAVTGGSLAPEPPQLSPLGSWADELANSFAAAGARGADAGSSSRAVIADDAASNYGSFDHSVTDVRRLSFISFADVVQAEQQGQGLGGGGSGAVAGSRDSMHLAGLTSLPTGVVNRSPSPIRSPVSSSGGGGGGGGGASPPASKSGSVRGAEPAPGGSTSPVRRPLGSPRASSVMMMAVGPPGSAVPDMPIGPEDINVETMSQALRRTGSADLSGVRSLPVSPVEGPSR